ncbi:hypothetical protein [Yeosuana sp.]|uniref:hypothetical protein n=1 Tax=Yeosuana sp. TaxID=2529388 RepID=UPI004055355F|tara:strand:+ start:737 stop:1279 length:543 start_codon:yes stop_codon:yes gene_type:complete
MNTKHIILAILLIGFSKVRAQTIFKTQEGHILMMALQDDQSVKAESHKLSLFLHYDSKTLNGVLDLKTLTTDIPEINTLLAAEEEPLILRFIGDIPSIDFLSKIHDPIDFNWWVTITYKNNTYKSPFKATIIHIYQGTDMSCIISARGQVLVSDTGLNNVIPNLGESIEIEFAQMVLRLQ